eukprot:scaffold9322_cov120-Isochrysis_galbana.AAC.7
MSSSHGLKKCDRPGTTRKGTSRQLATCCASCSGMKGSLSEWRTAMLPPEAPALDRIFSHCQGPPEGG